MNEPGARTLVFDCFSGIAGDMALAALLDAGASLDSIRQGLGGLGLPPVEVRAEHVTRSGLTALHVQVIPAGEEHYEAEDMRRMITSAPLAHRVRRRAIAAIDALEAGEAMVHGGASGFHEVGGVDAMVDVVGTMLALESLGVAECFCPVVTVGSGTVARSAHGVIPAAPGPAAAQILQAAGFALRFIDASHEMVTPTGAAILAAVAQPVGAVIVPTAHGAGAGTFDPPGRPNALRVFIGRPPTPEVEPSATWAIAGARRLSLLEANIDDLPPTFVAHARDRLLEEGALDAWTEPIGMKKGRAATKLCALVPVDDERRFADLYFAETSTLGVRIAAYQRFEAERAIETIDTSLGRVRVKFTERAGRRTGIPEYEDVRRLAADRGRPAFEVYRLLVAEIESPPE